MKILDTYINGNKEITKYDTGRIRVRTINELESRTDKTKKEQCDVNNIIKKFRNTGEWPVVRKKEGIYLDHTNLPDYQGALDTVIQLRQTFEELPSHIRKRFSNDPQEMINFLEDPSNQEEAIKLGLRQPQTQKPQPTEAEKYYATQNAKEKKASQKQQQQKNEDE